MQEILLKIRYFGRGLSKSLKKVNLMFSFKPIPFSGQSFQEQKGPGASEKLLFVVFKLIQKLQLQIYGSQFITS